MDQIAQQDVLGDVKPEHYFITKKGKTIKNIEELHNYMAVIDEQEFKHHVNEQRNDFHNWIRDIHKDQVLANNLLKAKTRVQTAMHIKNRMIEHKAQREAQKKAQEETETAMNHENVYNDQPPSSKHEKREHSTIKNMDYMKARVAEFAIGILFGATAILIYKSMA
jgi:hypothetical protein